MSNSKKYKMKHADFKDGSDEKWRETGYSNKKQFEKNFDPKNFSTAKIFRFNKGEYVFVLTMQGIIVYTKNKKQNW